MTQKDKTRITRLVLFFKQVLTEEPEVNSYTARLPNRIFTLSRLLQTGVGEHLGVASRPRGVGAEAEGAARDCLGQRTHLRGRGSLSADLGLSGLTVQVTGTSYCPPRQNPEHGRPGIPATGEGTPGVRRWDVWGSTLERTSFANCTRRSDLRAGLHP